MNEEISNGASAPSNSNFIYIIVTVTFLGCGYGCYKYGRKKGRKETEKKYETRLKAALDRVNTILAEKEAQY